MSNIVSNMIVITHIIMYTWYYNYYGINYVYTNINCISLHLIYIIVTSNYTIKCHLQNLYVYILLYKYDIHIYM